jgi:hypothetical protein
MTKTGKDREGNFHPPKGKPSGEGSAKGITEVDISTPAELLTEEDLPGDIHFRHPNRNPDKRSERTVKKDTSATGKNSTITNTVDNEGEEITPPLEIEDLTRDVLKSLVGKNSANCITIFIPTHQSGMEVNEQVDLITFKSALQKAAAILRRKNIPDHIIQHTLAPAYKLLLNDRFWRTMKSGLAVFLDKDFFQYYRMPVAPVEKTIVGTSFTLGPLSILSQQKEYFYLLVLSKKQAQIYRADRFSIQNIPISELPRGMDDVIHFEEKDDQKLFRTGSSGAGHGANYHGIGAGKPDDKQNIAIYLEEVDETLRKELLAKENHPLLLAGVEYLLPIFKQVSKYPNICSEFLRGSYENADARSLHGSAMEIMQSYFNQSRDKALELYGNKSATELTSSIPEDVIPAAFYGRVSTLFVRKGSELWGSFNEMDNQLTIHADQQDNDESLVERTIAKTLETGGLIYELDSELMPGENTPLAAIMRY